MHILSICGVSPFGASEMINPYLQEMDREDFSNVGRHCVGVAYAAEKIADILLQHGLIIDKERDTIIIGALLHDGDKRLEVMRKKAKNI